MKPIKDNVLVARFEEEKTTESGLILTGNVSDGLDQGHVLAVGSECQFVKEGDMVIPQWGKATVYNHEGISCVIIKEEDILAILDEE
jgi:chaperonin GroES